MNDFLEKQGVCVRDDVLATLRHTTAGTAVLSQTALALVPLPGVRGQRCNYCLRQVELQCCSRCRSAYFCSNECFRNAWLHFHRVLCEPQEYDIYTHVDADRWLLERTALTLHSHTRLSKHHSHSPPQLPWQIETLHSLPVPARDTAKPDSRPIDISAVAAALHPFGCHISPDDLDALWHRSQRAAFDIVDHEHHLDRVAVGVYPLTARYVRHSCRPNCGVVYKRGAQVLVALEDLPPGTPLTISYTDLICTRAERHASLRARFGQDFVCTCARCAGEYADLDALLDRPGDPEVVARDRLLEQCKTWSILDMTKRYASGLESRSPTRALDAPNFTHFVSRIIAPEIYRPTDNRRHQRAKEEHFTLAERILPALHALSQVPNTPAFSAGHIRAAQNLLMHYMKNDRWVEASRAALYLFVVYRLIYSPLHPVLSYHSLILARASWNSLVQLELAGIGRKLEKVYLTGIRTWIDVAREEVATTFGQECSLWREIIELQWVFERDQKLSKSS